jgi:hypothetical protein
MSNQGRSGLGVRKHMYGNPKKRCHQCKDNREGKDVVFNGGKHRRHYCFSCIEKYNLDPESVLQGAPKVPAMGVVMGSTKKSHHGSKTCLPVRA